jgi:hypothetical protein
MRALIMASLPILLAGLSARSLAAQEPPARVPVPSLLEIRLHQVKGASRLRIEDRAGQRVSGIFAGLGDGGLAVTTSTGLATIPLTEIQGIWIRRRSTAIGAIAGGAVGVGLGVLYGLAAAGLCECETSSAGAAALGGLLAGAGGAVVGGAIGAAIPRWSRKWP